MKVEEATVTKYLSKLSFIKNWADWRKSLHEGVAVARGLGLSDEEIQEMTMKVGDFLNERVQPSTSEDKLLKDMWDVASEDERKSIASVLFKLVK